MTEEVIKQFESEHQSEWNTGALYDFSDPRFDDFEHTAMQRIREYNLTAETPEGLRKREEILRSCMGTYGEGLYIIPPVHANNGLRHVHVGKNVVINYDAHFVDNADIYIGDDTMFGPNVTIVTAQHPISPRLRIQKFQYSKPVHIGKNVWLGAGVIVLPGVTIGDNSIIGAGAIVTKDVEPDSIYVGAPARLLRKITEKDDEVYDRNQPIPEEIIEKYLR